MRWVLKRERNPVLLPGITILRYPGMGCFGALFIGWMRGIENLRLPASEASVCFRMLDWVAFGQRRFLFSLSLLIHAVFLKYGTVFSELQGQYGHNLGCRKSLRSHPGPYESLFLEISENNRFSKMNKQWTISGNPFLPPFWLLPHFKFWRSWRHLAFPPPLLLASGKHPLIRFLTKYFAATKYRPQIFRESDIVQGG